MGFVVTEGAVHVGTATTIAPFWLSFLLLEPLPVLFVTVTLRLYVPFAVPAGIVTTMLSDPAPGLTFFEALMDVPNMSAVAAVVPVLLVA
jgi:hypothetical protein